MTKLEEVAESLEGELRRQAAEGRHYFADPFEGEIIYDGAIDLPSLARAAVEALREPTGHMIEGACREVLAVFPNAKWDDPHVIADVGGFRTSCVHTADATWRSMCDAGLTEQPAQKGERE